MNLATRKRLFNRCDPREPLAPEDPRAVDLDAQPGAVRGRRWVEALAAPIELGNRPVFTYLTAQPGAGLTTELLRLAARLRDPAGAGLLVVHIDAKQAIDLHGPLDVPDMLVAVVERVEAAVVEAEGQGAPTGALPRLFRVLAESKVLSQAAEQRLPLTTLLRDNPAARASFRADVNAVLSRFASEVRSELILLDSRARRLGRKGIVVLFDSLPRQRGMMAERREILASAERLFVKNASLLELPLHAVYTVPVALCFRLDRPFSFLPSIRLFDCAGARSEAGFAAARRLVLGRATEAELGELWGAQAGAWVEEIMAWSGGSPREIVRLLRGAVMERALDAQALRQVLSLSTEDRRFAVVDSAVPWLARVHVEKKVSFDGPEQRVIAEQMVASGVLLRYQDEEGWFDVHPAVLAMPGMRAEIAQRCAGA